MCIVAAIFVWLTIVTTLVQRNPICADEYVPKRLETKTAKTAKTAYFTSSVNHSKRSDYYAGTVPCTISCFLNPPEYEIVSCATHAGQDGKGNTESRKIIKCHRTKGSGEITIGNKESVRGIQPGTLESLLYLDDDFLPTSGQLTVHLNVNMVRLDAKVFQGLDTVVTEVRLLNTVQIHPDSLLELSHLRVFEIESGQIPVLLANDGKGTNLTDKPVISDKPAYLRLLPADAGIPVSFNFETSCHRCNHLNSTKDDYVVISFKKPNVANELSELSKHSAFSIVFPQTCPRISHGAGCSEFGYVPDITVDDTHRYGEEGARLAFKEARQVSTEQYAPSLLILLSIWCIILTLLTLMIMGTAYVCFRRISHRKPTPRWLSVICANQQSSLEDMSSGSMNSEMYNKPPNIGDHESGILINPLMNESRTSWNSLQIRPRISRSDHNLKDKGFRSQRFNSMMNGRRIYRTEHNRRSIGSQTDFTDVDSEVAIYSSLQRRALPFKDPSFMDPPSRATSQHALSRVRQYFPGDSASRRMDRLNKTRHYVLDFGLSDIHPTGEQTVEYSHQTEGSDANMCKTSIILGHPTVYNLPPVAPTHQFDGRLPARKWNNMLDNCT
ncbi:unnamed protein product [Dicrocoelium dendriticum]|nr:unnamed protein product [Dicrocoelium dendriticum]